MDYAFLPPEVNSARMYAGPGPSSFLTAAGSWDALAAELATTAAGYEAVLTALATWQWSGPASQAMTAAAAHYAGWLQGTAEQTKQTAAQARSAAATFEQAYAMTVPPPAVAANRTQLSSLVATNLLGQNTAAIAATEAQYADYWAQDAAAMYGYAASSQTLTQLLPQFSSPAQTSSQAGVTAQQAAVAQANASAAASDPVSQLIDSTTQGLQSLAGSIIPDDLTALDVIAAVGTSINSTYYLEAFAAGVIGAENNLGVLPKAGAALAADAAPAAAAAPPPVGAAAGLGSVTATLSRAGTIGQMSVPASWAAPSTSRFSALEPAGFTVIPGTEDAVVSGYPGYPGLASATAARGAASPPRYGARLTVMARPPAAG
ncbi:PPE family protein [Mycobacterium sp. Z3061]|uniref:PPE family protein n=1 Tax=Mycobacterium sp. Z3061 TaxID=3073562 RepID=UPI002873B681|nr:PPE family protein [Mycobacterium sp. Z3061]